VDEEIGWLPGWVERPWSEQKDIAERLAAEDQWIFDSWSSIFNKKSILRWHFATYKAQARTNDRMGIIHPRPESLPPHQPE
ncbi:MAG: hypothetical protein ACRCWS_01745, partial [Propionibacteriaceae bacterium]